jgi:transglutaminase-like putative cysteine protease
MTMQELLAPGRFVDSNTPSIEAFAHRVTAGLRDETDRIVRLYRAVRDSIVYDPYVDVFDQQKIAPVACWPQAAVFASASRRC